MNELSRSDKILIEKTVCVLLVRGEAPDGSSLYAYVGVKADRLEEFMRAQQSGMFYPEQFGVIIASGAGEPTDEIRLKMESEYGFNHEAMLDIPDAENAVRVATQLSKHGNAETD